MELSSLLLSECQSVFNRLLLYLSVNREQVFQGFSILACNDSSYEGPKEIKSDSDVVSILVSVKCFRPKVRNNWVFFIALPFLKIT